MINFSKEQMYNTINTIANEELNLETARKMIAQLVVENADMKKRIYKSKIYVENNRLYDVNDNCINEILLDLLNESEVK